MHLCARCTGIYPGIVVGLIAYSYGISAAVSGSAIVLLPSFALVDWIVTHYSSYDGTNSLRTLTGFLLGLAYGLGLYRLLDAQDFWIVAVGAFYGGLAFLAIRYSPSSV